ncbi:phosphatase PAP2 family protein [Hydrogenoanaerobacterium sp.]|uniref:phosphatase PAP2 family protein n=1 Tax=Hydrogenoanaerobacterium sp. TaxID=2953763 RepID=UPI00289F02E6|nr:phosphatase PAP2 family protein [Hydrogenoanaerobacterium sp.]
MELQLLHAIQAVANPVLDYLFIGITVLGEPLVAVAVLTIAYWLWDKETGEYLSFTLLFSLNINGLIKNVCKLPRPIGEEGVRTLRPETATGHSFPSGHTQTAATLYGSLAWRMRRTWVTVSALLLTLLIAVSRLYLGVHWPKDVLVALLLGVVISFGGYLLFSNINEQGRERTYLFTAAAFLPLVILWADPDFAKGYGLLLGFAVAVPLEHRFVKFSTSRLSLGGKFRREAAGLVVLGAVKLLLKFILPATLLFDAIEYAVVAFTAFFVCPLMFVKLRI